MPARAAVWDLGSSSFHLLVCQAGEDGSLQPMLRRRALLNLGASVGATGVIPPERVSAALAAVRRLRRQLDAVGADVVVALATAALRDAHNGPGLVERLQGVLATPVRVLDGEEEARLCYIGQRAGVWMPDDASFSMDLGGGSLELAVGDQRGVLLATSVPLGATRLSGELRTGDVLTADDRATVRRRVGSALAEMRTELRRRHVSCRRTVVSGGTARALGRLATARTTTGPEGSAAPVNQMELPAIQVHALADQLADLPLARRLALPGMPARRAAVLPLGATILAGVAQELGIERFVVSEWGLREGALLDALAGASPTSLPHAEAALSAHS
jgi:exopolyphosphatase / guanosine-5'-triphosphate,3'-diphosphate pyrophosphatase